MNKKLAIKLDLSLHLDQEYEYLFTEIKSKIQTGRLQAALAVNQEVIRLYWFIGKKIIEKQNWGSKLIETLSQDLNNAFPETTGFSIRNIQRMRQFADYYPDFRIVPQSVAQLPWGHISLLIHKVKNDVERTWYADQVVNNGWSRLMLERSIKDSLFQRQAAPATKVSNYMTRLSIP